jgi:sulfate permease, SulP family
VGRRDLVAGTTVAAIAIPQAMAYALIAGVDPRFGLYSAIIVTLVASIFGSSSHLINGPTNAISLVVFSALAGFEARFDAYQAMFLLAVIVGIIQILIAVFKLGDLTRYISESVVLGFMAGAGLLIAIGQVGNFLGVSRTRGGDHSVLGTLWETITQSGPYNYYAVGLGLGTLAGALQKEGVTVLLAGVRSNLAKVLRNLSFEKWLPADWLYPEQEEVYSATLKAVRYACSLLNKNGDTKGSEAVYYLV